MPLAVTNRRGLVILALALLAATVAMLFASYRPEPLREFLVAKRDLPSGVAVSSADFGRVSTDLEGDGIYLSKVEPRATLQKALRKGELVPISALGSSTTRFSVVLTPSQPLSTAIRVGSLVDVWFVARATSVGTVGVPQRIGSSLEVLSIARPDSNTTFGSDEVRLEVAASAEDLAALMLASADGGFIGVVSNR